MKENNYSYKHVEPNTALILVVNFLKFLNLSRRYKNKSGIPTSKYFDLNEESDWISYSSICRFSSASATSKLYGPENNENWSS